MRFDSILSSQCGVQCSISWNVIFVIYEMLLTTYKDQKTALLKMRNSSYKRYENFLLINIRHSNRAFHFR